MDLDSAKENIMPLAGGRNARCLETVLSAENHHEILLELQKQRQEYEKAIHNYEGDDPLEPWFDYIQWIEQSYPSGGKENGLFEVLLKCLTTFEGSEKYFQDRRMIKLYIKYIDTQSNPQEYYQELYNQGIGTMVADLYMCWAYHYDICGNFAKTDEIFRRGLDARAQPFDELEQAHKHFGFTMSQRILYKDEASNLQFMSSMQERRQALTSLRTHKKKVGSIRTGAAVKSYNPGKVELMAKPSSAHGSNVGVKVFEDQNHDPNAIPPPTPALAPPEAPTPHSVVRSIIDSARKQENMREPGPWSQARLHDKRKGSLFGSTNHHELGFEIMEDEEAECHAPLPKGVDNCSKGIQLAADFVAKNVPQSKWDVTLTLETGGVGANIYPMYEKTHLYPNANEVYCPEEYNAWRWFKKNGIVNEFTQTHDRVWSADFNYGFHYYPNFNKKSVDQPEFATERFVQESDLPQNQVFCFPVNEVYPENVTAEFSLEEVRYKRWREGKRKLNLNTDETIIMQEDVDETQCVVGPSGRDRRSMFPSRKSIAAKMFQPAAESRVEVQTLPRRSVVHQESQPTNEDFRDSMPKEVPAVGSQLARDERSDLKPNPFTDLINTPAPLAKTSNFSIFEDANDRQKPTKSEATPTGPNKFSAFEGGASAILQSPKKINIYEDDGNDDIFKAPQSLARPIKVKIPGSLVQDDEEEKESVFSANETCSTQTFNFFIKSQSVSTPKHLRKSQICTPQVQQLPTTPSFVSPPTPPMETDSALSGASTNTLFPPKQLSIIMEMTETNTVSSGTKSTAETQDFDTESSKSNYTTKLLNLEQCATIDPVLEIRAGQKSCEQTSQVLQTPTLSSRRNQQHTADEQTIPAMMMSMKVFEDKTETVPKILLTKLPENPPASEVSALDNLFTMTPPRARPLLAPKIDSSVVNESMTFSKLSEITLPSGRNAGSSFKMFPRPNDQPQMQRSKEDLKNVEMKIPGSFAVNDSMTFSDFNDFTLPKLMERSASANTEAIVGSRLGERSFRDRSVPFNDLKGAEASIRDFNIESRQIEFKEPKLPDTFLMSVSKLAPPSSFSEDLQTSAMKICPPSNLSFPRISHIHESSLHIKEEARAVASNIIENRSNSSTSHRERSILSRFSEISRRQSIKIDHLSPNLDTNPLESNDDQISGQPPTVSMKNQSIVWLDGLSENKLSGGIKQESNLLGFQGQIKNDVYDLGRSIYMKSSPKTPKLQNHDWSDDLAEYSEENKFNRVDVDLDRTKLLIEEKIDRNVNPFDRELIKAFLDQIELCTFIEKLPNCSLVNRIEKLQKGSLVKVADRNFDVVKLVAEGGYGSVFCAKERSSGSFFAIKQERPANLWEYYICLELKSRINCANIMLGFMDVEYAVIGNNASLLITDFSKYGSLINVCHKVYAATGKNIDEFVVMVLASQLLSIIDHLHGSNIIHADVKPDNFLLMSKLSNPSDKLSVQLIDFGVSIDMLLFPPRQTFNYVAQSGFTCIEMLEKRSWTYQPDLFGLASTIHVLLFGKYMDVEKRAASWNIKMSMPRYFNKTLWNTIFTTLLNVRDCNSMPNLQQLRGLLEEEIVEKIRAVKEKISEFNKAIEQ